MLCDHQIPSLQHEGTVQRISAEHVCSVRSLSLWCCMKQKNNTIPFSNCSMQHLLLFIASHVCSRNHAVDDFVLRRSLASRSVEQMASNPGWNRSSMINHTFFFLTVSACHYQFEHGICLLSTRSPEWKAWSWEEWQKWQSLRPRPALRRRISSDSYFWSYSSVPIIIILVLVLIQIIHVQVWLFDHDDHALQISASLQVLFLLRLWNAKGSAHHDHCRHCRCEHMWTPGQEEESHPQSRMGFQHLVWSESQWPFNDHSMTIIWPHSTDINRHHLSLLPQAIAVTWQDRRPCGPTLARLHLEMSWHHGNVISNVMGMSWECTGFGSRSCCSLENLETIAVRPAKEPQVKQGRIARARSQFSTELIVDRFAQSSFGSTVTNIDTHWQLCDNYVTNSWNYESHKFW